VKLLFGLLRNVLVLTLHDAIPSRAAVTTKPSRHLAELVAGLVKEKPQHFRFQEFYAIP
jgi:hypothetical protein